MSALEKQEESKMIEVVNGVEYTYVRIKPKSGVIRGAVPIGNDLVYPPLAKPLPKDTYASRGVDFVSQEKDGGKNADYYSAMVKAYEKSKDWCKVVSADPERNKNNRKAIDFYKKHAGLEEKDEKEVEDYYAKKEKK